ncbi:MAG TPA: peptidase M23 [Saprospiraceae bacterium]|nr:peptidase M23 [Saprospiraceae bacterium]
MGGHNKNYLQLRIAVKYKRKIVKLRRLYRQLNGTRLFSLLSIVAVIGLLANPFSSFQTAAKLPTKLQLAEFPIVVPTIKYGFALDTFQVMEGSIKNNQFLSQILENYHVDYQSVDKLATAAKDIFPVTKLRAGKDFIVLTKDSTQAADYFIYEPDVFSYVSYQLKPPFEVKKVDRKIETEIKTASGIIESSLWNTMIDNDLSFELASKMEDALAWSIDFYHIQKGDQFKVIYENQSIDGKTVGVGKVLASYYKNYDNEYYAYYFENKKHHGYFDGEGRSMQKAFLKSPVKFARISSRYNKRRFHPILKRVRPHYGTDYAAPRGSKIYAVADGVVTKSSYTRGNGNYIKIRHDKSIQTQYLHMNGFAKGIHSGVHVKQGQVIGYVGSTGLATGPHVCFRFWKNGKQVNHLRLNLPPPDPMPTEDLPAFYQLRDSLKIQLEAIPYRSFEQKEIDLAATNATNQSTSKTKKTGP